MEDIFMGIWAGIFALVGGGLGGGITGYLRQKGVDLAKGQDVAAIQRSVEQVRAEFTEQMERLRADLTTKGFVTVQREEAQDRAEEEFLMSSWTFFTDTFVLLPWGIGERYGNNDYLTKLPETCIQSYMDFVREANVYLALGTRVDGIGGQTITSSDQRPIHAAVGFRSRIKI